MRREDFVNPEEIHVLPSSLLPAGSGSGGSSTIINILSLKLGHLLDYFNSARIAVGARIAGRTWVAAWSGGAGHKRRHVRRSNIATNANNLRRSGVPISPRRRDRSGREVIIQHIIFLFESDIRTRRLVVRR
jgi:hypothetical protein